MNSKNILALVCKMVLKLVLWLTLYLLSRDYWSQDVFWKLANQVPTWPIPGHYVGLDRGKSSSYCRDACSYHCSPFPDNLTKKETGPSWCARTTICFILPNLVGNAKLIDGEVFLLSWLESFCTRIRWLLSFLLSEGRGTPKRKGCVAYIRGVNKEGFWSH